MEWFFDWVPWWLWMVLPLGGAGALAFFVPSVAALALTIWNALPLWARAVLFAMGFGFIVWAAGRNQGRANERERRDAANARALQTRREVDEDVRKAPSTDIDRRLDRWLRDD